MTNVLAGRLTRVARAYGRVVRSRSYFPLWLGQLVSNFGDTLHYIGLVVLVFQLTGQGLAVAGLAAAEIVPVLSLGPIAGVVIDRFSRKAVLVGADLFRAILVFSLLWPQGVWHAYLVAAGLAAGATFFNPTAQAVMPALTGEDQRAPGCQLGELVYGSAGPDPGLWSRGRTDRLAWDWPGVCPQRRQLLSLIHISEPTRPY